MKIHTVKSPFMCREGQFEAGIRSLCLGLDVTALTGTDCYRCYLGKNKKTYYEINSIEALKFADDHKSFWKNHKGRQVAILPISEFKRVEVTE